MSQSQKCENIKGNMTSTTVTVTHLLIFKEVARFTKSIKTHYVKCLKIFLIQLSLCLSRESWNINIVCFFFWLINTFYEKIMKVGLLSVYVYTNLPVNVIVRLYTIYIIYYIYTKTFRNTLYIYIYIYIYIIYIYVCITY